MQFKGSELFAILQNSLFRVSYDYKKSDATKSLYQEQSGREAYFGAARHAELYEYAKDIYFDDTCNTIQTIMDAIMA